MIESGKTLQQRYLIDRQIGQGGMGAVYVATDERFGSTVAIKETLCMDDNFRKAIEREARLLNSLKHAALPRVSDHFEEDNGLFLVMEYIPGDDLGSMLEPASHKFPVEQVLKWADQLLDALDYLHNQEMPVIHRDIKPQNLKITARGDMILLDFGLAKGNPTDAANNTAAKSIFGYSRNYASLEQIQGTGTDPRSDLYSLAATLYHLLTSSAPADALTRAMAVLSNRPDPLVPANLIDPAVPRGVAGVLHKALSLNADERPASAAAMREMLRENEKYAYLADEETISLNATQGVSTGYSTEVMPSSTLAGDAGRTEARTELMPAAQEELTALRPGSGKPFATRSNQGGMTIHGESRRRGKTIVAGALLLLIFGGAIGGGLYLTRPDLFHSPAASQNEPQVSNTEVPALTDQNVEPPTLSDAGANSAPPSTTAANDAPGLTVRKSQETVKGTKQSNSAVSADTEPTDVDVPVVEVRNVPGGIDIVRQDKNGKTTVTHVETEPKAFRPPMPDMERALRGIDRSKLTPEQRRKLQEALRMTRGLGNTVTPKPPDQP